MRGTEYTDTWCLGGGDVHITVCLDDQKFYYISKQNSRPQYSLPEAFWTEVTAIIGLGAYPQTEDDTWSFINNAY